MDERLSILEMDALMGRWRLGTIIVVLTGFFDESGEHDADGKLVRLTLGGYFATWENVKALCERWREALADENLGEFHMKHIASDEHDYLNWAPERRNRLDRFVRILADCAYDFHAFNYSVDPNRSAFKDTYETGLSKVLIAASTLAHATGEQVRLVFAQTQEISAARIGEYFDCANWAELDFLEDYRVARSRHEPALQAAEIPARGLKRLMEDGRVMPSLLALALTGKPFRFWPVNPVAASQMIQVERRADG